jgi:cellulose synthase (UDP-forming)
MWLICWKFFLTALCFCFAVGDGLLILQNLSGLVDQVNIWMPLLWVVAGAAVLRSIFPDAPPVWLRWILTVGAVGLNLRYLYWRITATLVLDWYNGWASVMLVAMEAIAILNTTIVVSQTIRRTNHSPKADLLAELIKGGEYSPSVDVFVPTYDEPISILRPTLVGCKAMRYPHKTIWLLDDGDRPEAAALAAELGCRYIARPAPRKHAKAGNLAAGLAAASGDIIVTFDADFVPLNHFLERALGFFMDPKLAMIVTPQNFYNPDPPEVNLGGMVLPHEQTVFYSIIQAGRDTTNSVICTGTSILFRRSALDAIGGFPTNTIVEDWVTGMTLQSRGYKTMYLNELLSLGAAPGDLSAYLIQRIRWAEGTLKTLFSEYSPLWMKGMSPIQRINHASGVLYWIDQASQSFAYFAPILYLLLGMQAISTNLPDILRYWLPNYIAGMILVSWSMGARTIVISFAYNVIQCFHLLPVIFNTIFRPNQKVKFKTTPKEWWKGKLDASLLTPLFILLVLNIYTIALGFLHFEQIQRGSGAEIINLVWAQFNMLILVLGILSCLGVTDERSAPRLELGEIGWVARRDRPQERLEIKLVDISETGVGFRLPRGLTVAVGEILQLGIPSENLQLTMRVQRVQGVIERSPQIRSPKMTGADQGRMLVGCQFEAMTSETLNRLIEFMYTRPQHWSRPIVANEWQSFRAIFLSLFEAYPIQVMLRNRAKARAIRVTLASQLLEQGGA